MNCLCVVIVCKNMLNMQTCWMQTGVRFTKVQHDVLFCFDLSDLSQPVLHCRNEKLESLCAIP